MTPAGPADVAPRPPIRPLPPLLVNQIAAGEVVERPASVVKEVVENALDARATRITVELEAGGIELIRVSDDGIGIPEAELPLAVAPHATSKLTSAQDLDSIATLGFRGEALASIASVSRLEIRSRTGAQEGAASISAEGEVVGAVRPAAGPVGTAVTVRNLFFNTPARRKFLRTPATELGRCVDVVSDLALGHPSVGFSVRSEGRLVLDLPAGQSPRERGLAVLGRELEGELLEVTLDELDDARGVSIWGLVGRPTLARATTQAQHVLLNGRVIRDKLVQHAIREAFRGLIEPGRHPTALLMIEMAPGAVDVNVHPAKTEVRFRDPSLVHTAVLRAIREALRREDLTPTLGRLGGGGGWAGGVPGGRAIQPTVSSSGVDAFIEAMRSGPVMPPEAMGPPRSVVAPESSAGSDAAAGEAGRAGSAELPTPVAAPRVLQVHKSYLVTQDEQGVVIVDQHALHERVMFEQLVERVSAGPLESQRLLTPVVVEVSPRQMESLESLSGLLGRLGVEASALGPTSVGVHAFATFLFDRGVDAGEFVSDLLERASASGLSPDSEEALRDVLDMMACKAAVKAGERMSDGELMELMSLRERVERASNCPHGRPTTVRLTIRQLERLFGRS